MKKFLGIIAIAIIITAATAWLIGRGEKKTSDNPAVNATPSTSTNSAPNAPPAETTNAEKSFDDPLAAARSRVIKKTFGLYVDPQHSPVSPERFTGYHTGADFETSPAEQEADVPIYAICGGKLLVKKYASGYGGLAVQSCVLNNAPITVVYGHLRLASIAAKVGDPLAQGEKIGVLGAGYTSETDGERKHLHLGIHRGAATDIRGYVATASELAAWIDPLAVIK